MKLIDPSLSWYVVQCRTGMEERCFAELLAGGFDSYYPRRRRKKLVGRSRILREVEDAAMRGYVFVAGSDIDWGRFRDDRHFEHVGRPLCSQVGPLRIPGKLVEQIQIDEMNGEFDETGLAKLEKRFPQGMAIKVPSGALRGFPAIIECVTAKQRISALADFLGRWVRVEIDPAQLEDAA